MSAWDKEEAKAYENEKVFLHKINFIILRTPIYRQLTHGRSVHIGRIGEEGDPIAEIAIATKKSVAVSRGNETDWRVCSAREISARRPVRSFEVPRAT